MNLDSEALVQQFALDYPDQFERSHLRLLVDKLTDENEQLRAEIDRLTALQPGTTYSASNVRPYVGETLTDVEGTRHG